MAKQILNKTISKRNVTLLTLIVVLILSVTGVTYAYFAISASNSNTITGTAATASLDLTVTKNYPTKTNTGVMVPQLSTTTALSGAVSEGCVDDNNNIVCEIFTIKIENNGTAQVRINGTMSFNYSEISTGAGATYQNLYWREMDSTTSLGTHTTYKATTNENTVSTTSLEENASIISNLSLVSQDSRTYYVIIWIEETNTDQKATDKGKFNGTVKFNAIDTSGNVINGVTSTITS